MTHNLDITDIVNNLSDDPNEIRPNETNFEKVVNFNKVFGVPIHNSPQINICKENVNLTKLRLNLILEEVQELSDAHKDNDFPEIIDANCSGDVCLSSINTPPPDLTTAAALAS